MTLSGSTSVCLRSPLNVTWNPSSFGFPTPPKPTTVSTPPAIASILFSIEFAL